jgi:hypothetical protein
MLLGWDYQLVRIGSWNSAAIKVSRKGRRYRRHNTREGDE